MRYFLVALIFMCVVSLAHKSLAEYLDPGGVAYNVDHHVIIVQMTAALVRHAAAISGDRTVVANEENIFELFLILYKYIVRNDVKNDF
ncbi:hypothetical protein Bhyg_06187, partial [Pseudolycoriella hygida]